VLESGCFYPELPHHHHGERQTKKMVVLRSILDTFSQTFSGFSNILGSEIGTFDPPTRVTCVLGKCFTVPLVRFEVVMHGMNTKKEGNKN
jgi:hypothetical protein